MEKLESLCAEVAQGAGLLLYDFEMGTDRGRPTLRVFVDREGGIEPGQGASVEDCQTVSHELGQLLDVEDTIPFAFVLEVSSPGIERVLRRLEHYKWAVGSMVHLVLVDTIEGQNTFDGHLEEADEAGVRIRVQPPAKNWKKGQKKKYPPVDEWTVQQIPLSSIRRANVVWQED